jgi:hypothetical protein
VRLKPVSALTFPSRAPLVQCDGAAFLFLVDGRVVYDLEPVSPGDALRQIQHLASKTWVQKKHLREFARLAADRFEVSHR